MRLRVLQTVKWLGDVYSVRLEAITVRLFETAPQKYSIAFERLLPLPAEADFDMTIRERENRKRAENASRRPAVLPLLVNEGKLHHSGARSVTSHKPRFVRRCRHGGTTRLREGLDQEDLALQHDALNAAGSLRI